IHFYVSHGAALLESYAMEMESFFGTGSLTVPTESREGGEFIPDYFLGFPRGLKLNVRRTEGPSARTAVEERLGGIPDNFVINLDADRWIPLSVLFKDSRVERATEIHWSACRVKAPPTATLKSGYLYYTMKGDAQLYGGHGKVTPLTSRTSVRVLT
ncbi:MAG: putative adhesin, partial [Planctomycetota bacterium]